MTRLASDSNASSDLSLAVRLQDGSQGAWADFGELYGPLVESWLVRTGLNQAVREDIAQEVFLSVHRSIADFDSTREDATFRGWLWRITRNSVLQSLRNKQVAARGGSTALARLEAFAAPVDESQFAESVSHWTELSESEPPSDANDTAALLRRAMHQVQQRVDPLTWQAFWNTAALNRSANDVAADLKMTPAAVRKAKSRTMQRLRKQLGDQS